MIAPAVRPALGAGPLYEWCVFRPQCVRAVLAFFGIVVSNGGHVPMTKEHANEDELQRPALYMLWPNQRSLPEVPSLPPAYRICAVASERVDQTRSIVEADGVLADNEWQRYRDSLVPDGLFAILDSVAFSWK
jgi:hypothetical protein